MMRKFAFKRKEDLEEALKGGKFKKNEVYFLDETCHYVCIPEANMTCSVIFWQKIDASDNTPTWKKVVCIYFSC
jgi:hypothetical protein